MSTPVGSYASLDAVAAATPAKDASPGFRIVGPNPKITFATQSVPPPSALYVTELDCLQVRIYNLSSIVTTLDVFCRLLNPEGEIKYFKFTTPTLTQDGVRNIFQFQLSEGFLLSAMVAEVTSFTVQPGDIYVQLVMCRGTLFPPAEIQLVSDYTTFTHAACWPGGQMVTSVTDPGSIQRIHVANPPVGNSFSVACPANTRWRLNTLCFNHFASAAGVPRTPIVQLNDSLGGTVFVTGYNVAQPVSTAFIYSFGAGVQFGALSASGFVQAPLPDDYILKATDTLVVSDNAMQAGDQFSNIVLGVEQWVDV